MERMGTFLNPDNKPFMKAIRSGRYVDKTMLLDYTNSVLNTENEYICVSRPRRFGKSIDAKMLCAYYSKGCQSDEIFDNLEISKTEKYKTELNNSNVIFIDVQWFRSVALDEGKLESSVSYIQESVIHELRTEYPEIVNDNSISLANVLKDINQKTGEQFIVIIDEWDCFFREDRDNKKIQEKYVNFLRSMFKGVIADSFIKLAYLTGILPIKKYGTQSALNNFHEYTMIKPLKLAPYVGFTEDEVKRLCEKYNMDFAECKLWYDGYSFSKVKSIYSPNSVMLAMDNEEYGSYWTKTETYESLRFYIDSNYDNVKDDIITMLSGGTVKIDPETFQNDLVTITCKDDVFTLLVHLGYLAYDNFESSVYIPNKEVRLEFLRATRNSSRSELVKVIKDSDALLTATLQMDEETVANAVEKVHNHFVTPNFYNNEQSLRSVILNAYLSRVDDYVDFQELPSGKGYADILFYPRKGSPKPALLIELKWNKSSDGAINQIHAKQYANAIENFGGEILLVGINYDTETKKHTCIIENFQLKVMD
jgi:hypothetical protein